jgi:solute carrier family 25 folate transporter 32
MAVTRQRYVSVIPFVYQRLTAVMLMIIDVIGYNRQYTGLIGAFRTIIREEGPLALYRGLTPALLLVSNGAFEFAAYEELKKHAIRHCTNNGDEKQLSSLHFLAMGAAAKVIASTLTFPLSVTRARLYQRNPDYLLHNVTTSPSSVAPSTPVTGASTTPTQQRTIDMKYRDMRHVITSIYGHDGIRGFYRGLLPQLMKTAPASAITFACYETIVRAITATNPSS